MTAPLAVTPELLAGLAPPLPTDSAHKGVRGRVLVVGGSSHTPGAVLLSGLAALRAGAGVLQVATVGSAATTLAVAMPEARVVGLHEDGAGEVSTAAVDRVIELAGAVDAVLVGPGMAGDDALQELVPALLGAEGDWKLVVDARALAAVTPAAAQRIGERLVLTPNGKEAADLLGIDPAAVEDDPVPVLGRLVERFGCTVAVRAGGTVVGQPGCGGYEDNAGTPGLGTSGSGDVVTGFMTGLLARGTTPLGAALWAVHVHALAGERLAARLGRVGYLARELLDEVSMVADGLQP